MNNAPNQAKDELGQKILKIKKAKGWKWNDIADRLGYSPKLGFICTITEGPPEGLVSV